MMTMKYVVEQCEIQGLLVFTPQIHFDDRGSFEEIYNFNNFANYALPQFVQLNRVRTNYGVIRGIGAQVRFPQAKLIYVSRGAIHDVTVDCRRGSPTYGRKHEIILSEENRKMLFIPEGFAHGYQAMGSENLVEFFVSDYYHEGDEKTISWNDPDLKCNWPIPSKQSIHGMTFKAYCEAIQG